MKTKKLRSDGHGLVQVCNYPSRLMKTKQRHSYSHGLVEYKHATIPADLLRQNNVIATVTVWYSTSMRLSQQTYKDKTTS